MNWQSFRWRYFRPWWAVRGCNNLVKSISGAIEHRLQGYRNSGTSNTIAPLPILPLLSLFLMSGLLLAGCDSAPPAPAGPRPTVARICRDGSYIYRHADGTYWAWNGYRIDDIDKVCDR
jgi:hypothetical protein